MKSGFAVLIGRSNVGKSTLLNRMIGTKVAITTPKPQTTRRPIQGALTIPDEGQVVFVDTPGLMQKARDPLTKKLNDFAIQSLEGIDVVLYVVDPTRSIGDEEQAVLRALRKVDKPKLLIINKTDELKSKQYIDFYRDLAHEFDAKVEVSAKTGSNVDRIATWIMDHLNEGEFMYPEFEVTNMPPEERIAELIREKLFLRLREELPYTTDVVVEEMHERDNGVLYISAVIKTTEERYKRMIIGAGGRGVREIGQATRNEMEATTGKKIYLELDVQVDPHWVERYS